MIKSLIIFFLFIFSAAINARASKLDDNLCNQTEACKKYCDLREKDKYDENNQSHEELMIECFEDMSGRDSEIKTELLESIQGLLIKLNADSKNQPSKKLK
jgi:hypothetical protein